MKLAILAFVTLVFKIGLLNVLLACFGLACLGSIVSFLWLAMRDSYQPQTESIIIPSEQASIN